MKILPALVLILTACQMTSTPNSQTPQTLNPSIQWGTSTITGSSWQNTQIPHDEIIQVGIMLPLTGRAADLGQDMKRAVEMALFQSKPQNIILKIYDTQDSESGLQSAIQSAKQDSVELIIGPIFSNDVKQVASQINKPILSFTTDTNVLKEGVYSFGLTLQDQLKTLLSYGKETGKNKLGLLLPENQDGYKIAEDISAQSQILGIDLTRKAFYPPNNLLQTENAVKSFADYVSRKNTMSAQKNSSSTIRARYKYQDTWGSYPYDMIFVGGSDASLETAVSFLRYYEVDPAKVQYLGTSAWTGDTKKTLARTNAWISGIDSTLQNRFNMLFEQQYGHAPKGLAILAYDAMTLVAHLAKDGSISRYEILDPNGYRGATGVFRFTDSGRIERELEIQKLSGTEETRILKSAKTKF